MTTFRAAYIPAPANSTSGGFLLTDESHSALSDADLLAAAAPGLAEYNANAAAIGESPAAQSDIEIGEWRE